MSSNEHIITLDDDNEEISPFPGLVIYPPFEPPEIKLPESKRNHSKYPTFHSYKWLVYLSIIDLDEDQHCAFWVYDDLHMEFIKRLIKAYIDAPHVPDGRAFRIISDIASKKKGWLIMDEIMNLTDRQLRTKFGNYQITWDILNNINGDDHLIELIIDDPAKQAPIIRFINSDLITTEHMKREEQADHGSKHFVLYDFLNSS